MKVITLINEKGGVGKTTLSVHLAAGLAARGKRVLVIDADAQGHSTRMLRIKEHGGLYRLLIQEAEWKEVLAAPPEEAWVPRGPAGRSVQMGRGSLWLLPSNVETRLIPMATDDVAIMVARLDELRELVDVVVVDTSPTPSLLHAILYSATDYAILPTLLEDLSLDGISKSHRRLIQHNEARHRANYYSQIELLGIQPTLLDVRTNAHLFGLSALEKRFGARMVWPGITGRTVWRDAAYERRTVFAFAPQSEAAAEAWGMVERVERALEGVADVG